MALSITGSPSNLVADLEYIEKTYYIWALHHSKSCPPDIYDYHLPLEQSHPHTRGTELSAGWTHGDLAVCYGEVGALDELCTHSVCVCVCVCKDILCDGLDRYFHAWL